jgi:hypothetical protein
MTEPLRQIPKEQLELKEVKYRKDMFPSSIVLTSMINGVLIYQKYFSDNRERGEYKK